ncbi:MAG: dipeptide epimerase [Chloroflexota bacterium]|nr:dipeptide epimerase [Chloroflexota bacterium]
MVHLAIEPITLNLKTPFRIAHGTSLARHNVLVHLGDGVGEGALAPYYGYSQAEIVAYLYSLDPGVLLGDDPLALEDALDRLPPGPAPARAAIDVALHDYWAKRLGQPLYRLWGLNPMGAPLSSLTLSITEDEEELRRRVRAAEGFPILKLKLGAGNLEADEAIVRVACQEKGCDVRLCVDANGAWQVDEAARVIPRLAAYDLLFIEQPIPQTDAEDWHRLRRLLPGGLPPLIADESVQRAGDLLVLAGAADGINIKLAKAGGLRKARRMIALARTLGMQVMLGCMVESSVGITAAAHLAPLVDFADLDGNLDVTNDPYVGVKMEYGRLYLPEGTGLGVDKKLSED